jgi:hypothetical protein
MEIAAHINVEDANGNMKEGINQRQHAARWA